MMKHSSQSNWMQVSTTTFLPVPTHQVGHSCRCFLRISEEVGLSGTCLDVIWGRLVSPYFNPACSGNTRRCNGFRLIRFHKKYFVEFTDGGFCKFLLTADYISEHI